MASQSCHTTTEVVFVATTALAVGSVVGAAIVHRETKAKLRKLKLKIAHTLGLDTLFSSSASPASSVGEVAPGVRASDLPAGKDMDDARNTKLAVIILRETVEDPAALLCQTACTVLGQFKKLYKRRDDSLKLWEAGGHRMEIRVAQSEDVLMGVQSMARTGSIPTHTYAGRAHEHGKSRSLIVVGPTDKDTLMRVVGKLESL